MNMLVLGEFAFSLGSNTPYEKLERKSGGGWVTVPRFGAKPLSSNTGQPLDSIRILGKWFYDEGRQHLESIRVMMADKTPQLLTDSQGNNLGFWTLNSIEEKQDRVIDNGVPMIVDFVIELGEFANDAP